MIICKRPAPPDDHLQKPSCGGDDDKDKDKDKDMRGGRGGGHQGDRGDPDHYKSRHIDGFISGYWCFHRYKDYSTAQTVPYASSTIAPAMDLASKKEGKRRGHILSIITSPKVGPNRCARLELLSLSLSVSSFFQLIFRKVTSVYDSSRVLSKVAEIKR